MKIARFGSIFLLNLCVKWIIDNPLNVFLMIKYGYLISLTITTLLYILIGILSVKIYDHFGIDFIKVERNKRFFRLKTEEGKVLLAIYSILIVFIRGLLVSLKNTGLAVIVFRKGSFLFNGFEGIYTKLIFISYALFINVVWNLIVLKYSYLWIQALDLLYKSLCYWVYLFKFTLESIP